jgi:hypothetical protein
VLSLTVGIRTEEARELRWDHVDLDGDPGAVRPMPPSVAVWHSVRTALAAAGPVPGGTDPASLVRYAFAVAAGAVTSPGAPGAGPSRRVSRAAAGYGGVLRWDLVVVLRNLAAGHPRAELGPGLRRRGARHDV